MIVSYESVSVNERYINSGNARWGIRTTGVDQEEWAGIRSQMIALVYGWA